MFSNTDEEGRLIPTPSLQPLQPQGITQRSQGAEAIPRRGLLTQGTLPPFPLPLAAASLNLQVQI